MRSVIVAMALVVAATATASAQHWRDYVSTEIPYSVVGVQSWDVLNLRAGPGVRNRKIGALSPYARGIYIQTCNHRATWCRVSGPGGQSGWANMRYLGGYAH